MKLSFFSSACIFVVILALALTIYYQPWLCGQASFYLFDISTFYEPTLKVLAENWQQGRFMLWNPYSYCGMPQIAVTEPGLFYPPNWFFALVPFNQGLAVSLIFHQLIAGLGNFLLVGSFGWGLLPAAFAGLAAALCGYMFSLQTNYTLMACAAWCPMLLWLLVSIEEYRGVPRVLFLLLSSIVTTLMILTGRPEIFGPALMVIVLYLAISFAWKFSQGENKLSLFANAFWQLASLLLGVFAAAPGILPAMEWLPLSPRAEGLAPADTLFWSANWYDFLCLLLPQPLGDLYLRTSPFTNLALANPALEPYFASAFLGPILITFALVGIFDRQFKPRWFLVAVLIGFLVLAAGRFTPLGEFLLYVIPGIGVLRYPVKLLFFPVICLILFASRGLYLYSESKVSRSVEITCIALWSTLLAAGLLLMFIKVPIIQDIVPNAVTFLRLKFGVQLILQAQYLIGKTCIEMAGIGLLTCLVGWLKQTNKIGTLAFSISVLAATYGLFAYHAFTYAYHPAGPQYFDQKCYLERMLKAQGRDLSKLENLNGERFIHLYIAGLMQPNNLETGDAVQKTIDHYQLMRQMLSVSTHFHQHYGSSFGYLLGETADYRNLYVDVVNKSHISGKKLFGKDGVIAKSDLPLYRFCQVTSTAYVLGMIDKFTFGKFSKTGLLDPKYFDLWVEDPSWNARIYRVKDQMPHAYMSYSWQWLDSQASALQKIVAAEKSGFDPWKETLLEKPQMPEVPFSHLSTVSADSVVFKENSPNSIRLEVTTPNWGLLVLTDHYYPGWLATVDGKEVSVLRANGVMRGVFVQPGKHLVEFSYEPKSLRTAFIISLVACFLLIVIAFAAYLFDKRYK
jgi:hypothetical protein